MSIQLNSSIYTLLTTNTGFTALVGIKVFPVIAPNETTMPLVVITRDFTPQYSRDGAGLNDSNVEITILAINYNESVQIATIIDNILNSYDGIVGGVNIRDCRLVNCTEEYSNEAFIQKLFYTLKNH